MAKGMGKTQLPREELDRRASQRARSLALARHRLAHPKEPNKKTWKKAKAALIADGWQPPVEPTGSPHDWKPKGDQLHLSCAKRARLALEATGWQPPVPHQVWREQPGEQHVSWEDRSRRIRALLQSGPLPVCVLLARYNQHRPLSKSNHLSETQILSAEKAGLLSGISTHANRLIASLDQSICVSCGDGQRQVKVSSGLQPPGPSASSPPVPPTASKSSPQSRSPSQMSSPQPIPPVKRLNNGKPYLSYRCGTQHQVVTDKFSFRRAVLAVSGRRSSLVEAINSDVALELKGLNLGSEHGGLSLIQMISGGWSGALVFDVQELNRHPEGLDILGDEICPLLQDRHILKVMHDLTNDSIALERFFGEDGRIKNAFDTQLAHEALGGGVLRGLRATVQAFALGGVEEARNIDLQRAMVAADPAVFTKRPIFHQVLARSAQSVVSLLSGFQDIEVSLRAKGMWRDVLEASQLRSDFAAANLCDDFKRMTFREMGRCAGGSPGKIMASFELRKVQAPKDESANIPEAVEPFGSASRVSSTSVAPMRFNGKRHRDSNFSAGKEHRGKSKDKGESKDGKGRKYAGEGTGHAGSKDSGEGGDSGGSKDPIEMIDVDEEAQLADADLLPVFVDRIGDKELGEARGEPEHTDGQGAGGCYDGNDSNGSNGGGDEVRQRNLEDTKKVLLVLPDFIVKERLNQSCTENLEHVREVVMDEGSRPWADIKGRKVHLCSDEDVVVTRADVEMVVHPMEEDGRFGVDDRAGFNGQLHRISVMRDRAGKCYGITLRIGRYFTGIADVIDDLLFYVPHSGIEGHMAAQAPSILVLGRPGTGKTTVIREISRKLSEHQNVVIVDTSNEIGGDGAVPHPRAIGTARRMMVPQDTHQYSVMISALQNHTPQTIVVDEISNTQEAQACRDIKARGVRLVASAHGDLLSVLSNPSLNTLLGGKSTVMLGDKRAMEANRGDKVQVQRAGAPTFDMVVELVGRGKAWSVVKSVGCAVDSVLRDGHYDVEKRLAMSENGLNKASGADGAPFLFTISREKSREVGRFGELL